MRTDPDLITDERRWGYVFRFGLFEIPATDFELIESRMATG